MAKFLPLKAQNYDGFFMSEDELPIYEASTFDFFRCVEFNDSLYNVLATDLFKNNLRMSNGRYSKLFPNQKISYWSNSKKVARKEIKHHGSGNNILAFWAYDDASSSFPFHKDDEPLVIVDGRKCGIQTLIDKIENEEDLTVIENLYMKSILLYPIDAIVYDSKRDPEGENYIFLERGFKKLAIRKISLRFSKKDGGHHNFISCAGTCDYTPYLEAYGEYFAPKCKRKMDKNYLNSEEYKKNTEQMKINFDLRWKQNL